MKLRPLPTRRQEDCTPPMRFGIFRPQSDRLLVASQGRFDLSCVLLALATLKRPLRAHRFIPDSATDQGQHETENRYHSAMHRFPRHLGL